MVLRGAQFQRFGPAGCTFRTRRALFSCHVIFVANNLTKDSRRMTRAGDLCHGHIGESSSVSQPW